MAGMKAKAESEAMAHKSEKNRLLQVSETINYIYVIMANAVQLSVLEA